MDPATDSMEMHALCAVGCRRRTAGAEIPCRI